MKQTNKHANKKMSNNIYTAFKPLSTTLMKKILRTIYRQVSIHALSTPSTLTFQIWIGQTRGGAQGRGYVSQRRFECNQALIYRTAEHRCTIVDSCSAKALNAVYSINH